MRLTDSQTKENLMRAFAGESQAWMRYTLAAGTARQQKLPAIAMILTYTAGQEKEHAEIFWKYLSEAAGESVRLGDAGYPVDVSDNVAALLRAGQHGEYEEHDVIYPSFGDTAQAEGFPEIAQSFYQIAQIEQTHGDRFGMLAELLEQNKLYVSDVETGWVCLNCGHIHRGTSAPDTCPVCGHEQGYFLRIDLAPYTQG